MKSQLILGLLICGSATCAAQTTDEWVTATPASVGLDPEPLERLCRDVAEGALPNVQGILLVRDGKLVREEYFNGFDREIRQCTAFRLEERRFHSLRHRS